MLNFSSELKSLFWVASLMANVLVAYEPAGESIVSSCEIETPSMPCMTTLDCPPEFCAYNAPVLLNLCSYTDLYVTGSFLYWRASGDYLTTAFLDSSFSTDPFAPPNFAFNGEVLEPDFKYRPGYKLGLGYKFDRDHWDLYAEYTCYHQKIHTFQEADTAVGQHIHATWLIFVNSLLLEDSYRSVDSTWKTDLDILDAEVGRNFFCGRYYIVRPSLGLRTMWLKQNYDLTYVTIINEFSIDSMNQSSSWGIGPKFGLNNTWNLWGGLKILGDLGVSLLHFEDHVKVKQFNSALIPAGLTDGIIYGNKESMSIVKPILDLSLGLGWGYPLIQDKCSFDLELSYDYSVYWDQASIQLGHAPLVAVGGGTSIFQVIVGNGAGSEGNLSIQGLKLKARLDF